jgi:CBS domain-containing protein
MLKVRDIMSSPVFTVGEDASEEEAAWGLTRNEVGGAPVRDRDGHLVGMLTASDLIDPGPREWTLQPEVTVADRMTPVVYAVYEEDPALLAAELMAERRVHRVVVLDGDGKLSGIVSTLDVVRAVARRESFAVDVVDDNRI